MNISIKQIKGKKYVYLEDYVKVNQKSKKISVYVGKYPLIPPENTRQFVSSLGTLELKKLKAFTDTNLERCRRRYLLKKEAFDLEVLKYTIMRFKDLYPDESRRYEDAIYTKYTHGSTAIEGNTLTLREAHLLMDEGITPEGKSLREVYELINFKDLRKFISGYKGDISEPFIKKVHSTLMNNIIDSQGRYRKIVVLIEGAEYEPPPAFEVPELMRELIRWYNSNKRNLHPLELSGIFHARFETIHPFVDGNGRVGRALMNFILESRGYPTVYLGLEHKGRYIDAIAEGNRENYRPLIELFFNMLIKTYHKITEDFQASLKHPEQTGTFMKLIDKASGLGA